MLKPRLAGLERCKQATIHMNNQSHYIELMSGDDISYSRGKDIFFLLAPILEYCPPMRLEIALFLKRNCLRSGKVSQLSANVLQRSSGSYHCI